MTERKERDFESKVHAFNAGYERVKDLKYDIIGNLDADITFDKDYFAFLLEKFAGSPGLGVAGAPFNEEGNNYHYSVSSAHPVFGARHVFRRDCFEGIGGECPFKGRGGG